MFLTVQFLYLEIEKWGKTKEGGGAQIAFTSLAR